MANCESTFVVESIENFLWADAAAHTLAERAMLKVLENSGIFLLALFYIRPLIDYKYVCGQRKITKKIALVGMIHWGSFLPWFKRMI